MRTLTIVLLAAAATFTGCASRIPVIDTHIHLYDTRRPGGVPWPPPSDKVLYRPVLTEHYDAVSKANDVAATVIVEASDRVEDNQWVLDLVKHDPDRYIGLVGSLPIGTDAFPKLLERFTADPRFVGLRLRGRPKGAAFFTDAAWRDLKLMAAKGLVLDVLMTDTTLEEVGLIARRVPDLKILINHLTGLTITGEPADPAWAAAVRRVAKHPNVHCKVSGIFQRSGKSPAPREVGYYAPIFEVVYEAFGEDRIVYGSNWPVTDRGGTYAEQLRIIRAYFAPRGRRVLEKLFWRNAAALYGVRPKVLTKT